MKNTDKRKTQLIEESESLKLRVHELETVLCEHENALTTLKENEKELHRSELEDITERRWMESALKKSEHTLNIMINTVPDIIYRLDSKGNIIFVNQALDSIYWISSGGKFVEDEPSVCIMIVRILENGGYSVMKATNGEEALRIVDCHEPEINILVTDVVMLYMGGKELSVKLSRIFPAMKTLFMSGYTDNSIVNHGILEPDVAFIQKPFTPNEIALKVRQVLDN